MTILLFLVCCMEEGKAESTLERKLRNDEELSLAEMVKMLKEVKVNGEIQQATLETLAIAEIVGDLAVLKAEKEENIHVDFGALGDSYACFARCFEFLFRGIGNISRDIGAQLWRSWSQWDIVLKTVMSLMAFHVLSSLQSACMNSLRAIGKGWKTVKSASGLIYGVIGWSRRIPVKDDIEAYKQLMPCLPACPTVGCWKFSNNTSHESSSTPYMSWT